MNKKYKKRKNKKQEVDENIISSISSPNAWTKESEDAWLKQPAKEIRKRFPPLSKSRHIQRTAKPNYFLDRKDHN